MCLLNAITAARDVLGSLAAAPELCDAVDCFNQHEATESLQILLLGMFNRGKSTVINALLQAQVVPTGLVPLTGACIRIVYGESITTLVRYNDGSSRLYSGTEILQEVAVLTAAGTMREDIAEVLVTYPHPLLKAGVELVDLPGFNDKEEQEAFVRRRLFTADLILHVLSAADQWTLSERQLLGDWVLSQGLRNIVFLVNRADQMEDEEREEALFAIRDGITAEFDSASRPLELIYRFDALPALRSALKQQPTDPTLKIFLRDFERWVSRNRPNLRDLRQRKLLRLGGRLHDELHQRVLGEGIALDGNRLDVLAALCEALPEDLRTRCRNRLCTDMQKEFVHSRQRNPFDSRPYDAGRSPW